MRSSPDVMSSRPAIMRSRVDLPQPEGPTKTQNSPSSILRSMPWITSASPNVLVRRSSSRVAMMRGLAALLDARAGDAGGDVALEGGEHQRHRQERQHGHGEEAVPLGAEFALERVERELEG